MNSDQRTLDENVRLLTRQHKMPHYDREDGLQYFTEPALLDQLHEAIEPGMEGQSGKAFGTKAPLSVGALQLWRDIKETCHLQYVVITGANPLHKPTADVLRSWTARLQSFGDAIGRTQRITKAADLTGDWIKRINDLLDPPKALELVAACPDCGTKWVWRNEDGENVRKSALTITTDRTTQKSTCVCRHCGADWKHERLANLAARLERVA